MIFALRSILTLYTVLRIIDANPTNPGALVQHTNPVIRLGLDQRGKSFNQDPGGHKTGCRILWSIDYSSLFTVR